MTTLKLKERDTEPLPFMVVGADGAAMPITGYTFVLKIAYPESVLQITASIINASAGAARFPFDADDLKLGTYIAEILITSPLGERTSESFHLHIDKRL